MGGNPHEEYTAYLYLASSVPVDPTTAPVNPTPEPTPEPTPAPVPAPNPAPPSTSDDPAFPILGPGFCREKGEEFFIDENWDVNYHCVDLPTCRNKCKDQNNCVGIAWASDPSSDSEAIIFCGEQSLPRCVVYYGKTTPPVAAEDYSESPEEYTSYRYLPSVTPPDVFGCDAGSSNIDIVFNLDSKAKQISWSLTDTNSGVYVDGSEYDRDDNKNEVEESVTLCHSVCYEFEFNDSGGDGLCNGISGCGEFEIFIQDDVVPVLSGGFLDFLSVHKFSFCLDDSGNVRPQSGDENEDEYVIESVMLWKNKCYEFVIQNSEGNGLDGGYVVIYVKNKSVYDEDVNFGYSDTFTLCLDDRGNFVEPQSECDDDPTFLWKDRDNKDCVWVAGKLSNV